MKKFAVILGLMMSFNSGFASTDQNPSLFVQACESGDTKDRIDVTIAAMIKASGATGTCEEQFAHMQQVTSWNLEFMNAADETKGDQRISNLAPLAGLVNAKEIILDGHAITSIESLSGLKQLEVLLLNRNQIKSIKPLQNLTNLKILFFEGNQVSDLEPLRDLVHLQILRLDGNYGVENVEPLRNMSELEVLYLPMVNVPKTSEACPVVDVSSEMLRSECEFHLSTK